MTALVPAWHVPSTIRSEMDNLVSRLFGEDNGGWTRPFENGLVPAIESFVRENELVIRADLPGINPTDVELIVEGDRLTLKGERKKVPEGKDGERIHREVSYGRFVRSFRLPASADGDSVKASYHDGVLEVTMKVPKELVSKKVPIVAH